MLIKFFADSPGCRTEVEVYVNPCFVMALESDPLFRNKTTIHTPYGMWSVSGNARSVASKLGMELKEES